MEDISLLNKFGRVKAPPDFEQKVQAALSLRKKTKPQMARALRLSFAGAAAAVLICFILLNVFVLQKKSPVALADKGLVTDSTAREFIPITEPVDYSGEMRSVSYEPETIYILEQISEASYKEIKY